MNARHFKASLPLIFTLLFTTPLIAANEDLSFKEQLEKANEYIKTYRHFEAADALQEATKLGGAQHPSLHMRLGILYYGLGLIPEAIVEGEKAVALAPASKWYKYDLAKFYYVDKQYSKAEEQFTTLLKLDPGFTLGYYYLAELYYRNKDYDMAWLSLQRSRLLGHQGKHLEEKLAPHSKKPVENFAKLSKDNTIVRFIKLSSEEEAKAILDQIGKGKLFENLELELKKEKIGETDFGVMNINELKDSVAESLRGSQPYSQPVAMQTGEDYRIMQRIAPFDPATWRATVAATAPSRDKPLVLTEVPGNYTAEATKSKAQSLAPAAATPPEVAKGEPSPETEEPTTGQDKQNLSAQLAAYYALESWKNAWQSADIVKYLAAYSSKFSPADMDLATWKKKRTASLSRPKFIHVKIKDPVVEQLAADHLLITFTQEYESDSYQDTVVKILTMVKEKGGWKISDERSTETLQN